MIMAELFPLKEFPIHLNTSYNNLLLIMGQITVKCLSIGTPKNNKFSICSKWKINYFRCPKIWAHYSLIIMRLNIGTHKKH